MLEKVLIVDDSKFARSSNRKLLESLDHEVIAEATNGLDGIAKFKEFTPSLIITDIEMPDLDGIGMIKKIREDDTNVKIVVISSIVNSQIIQEAVKLKAVIVKKPIKKNRLLNAIKLLDR